MSKKTIRQYTPAVNLREICRRNARVFGDKILFKYFDSQGQVLTITYREFNRLVENTAQGFTHLGLCGKRIAVVGETCPEWMAAYIAAIASGSVIIPLDKELLDEETCNFLNRSEAAAFIFTKGFNKKIRVYADRCPAIEYLIPISTEELDFAATDKVLPFSVLSGTPFEPDQASDNGDAVGEDVPEEPCARRDMSVMLFTSGTTGTSKCVMLSEHNVISCVNAACESVDFCPEDVMVSVLPIHHTYELTCMLAEINYGMTICVNDSLKHALKNFKFFAPTGLVVVPLFINTIYKKIWDEAKKKGKDKTLKFAVSFSNVIRKTGLDLRRQLFKEVLAAFGGNLKKIICGGAAMNDEMTKNFDDLGITLCEGYGITECSPLIAVNPYYKRKKGSVGPAVPCCTVKIEGEMENEDGHCIGEILVKGDNVMLGYDQNPEANAVAFTQDGYFRTGDIGYLDDEGYLFITGREKSVIVLNNGKNVFPEEIEEYLSDIDYINECVVVGRKADKSDDIHLTAVIYPQFDRFENDTDIGAIAEAIKKEVAVVNKKLPGFKQIRNIEIRQTEFEKTTTKKIKRFKVQ